MKFHYWTVIRFSLKPGFILELNALQLKDALRIFHRSGIFMLEKERARCLDEYQFDLLWCV